MATIDFKGVNKIFNNGMHAVRNFTLHVKDGEMIVLVGPSGCGKSTLLRMVAGLEIQSSGEILLKGKPMSHLPVEQRDVAMVFQNYALYPHMTVHNNLAFPLKMMKIKTSRIRRRVQKIADLLRLGRYLDYKPSQLSGGQRQRVAMGRALVREPDVFLMDEPLSNLDAKLRVQMRGEITHLQKRLGTTTIYVTHDQIEAMTMGDRLVVIKEGVLQQVGNPQEIYMHPSNVFVATFIGSPSMNLLWTTVSNKQSEKPGFDLGGIHLTIPKEIPGWKKEFKDKGLVIGLRPESFVSPDDVPKSQHLEVTISHIEEMGHELIVYFEIPVNPFPESIMEKLVPDLSKLSKAQKKSIYCCGKSTLAARLPPLFHFKRGETITLGIKTEDCYFFNQNGDAL
ncbi:MAG: sn-glycerol-3-phosphate ABC transporter ATP-binding protein UgpC [Desulfobacula sp.]|nr:sn-glycerol-3-phosphate ABC transporter ATP-binding protein UgpC [Desulfobacula sp.]